MIDIIPAIDIMDGKCVRLRQGNFERPSVYGDDPLIIAQAFESAGIRRLHLVDLDGARRGEVQHWDVLEKIASHTNLIIDFSGGLSSSEMVKQAFDLGAAFVALGTIAVRDPGQVSSWINRFGSDRFLIGADVKDEMIAINGWTTVTNESIYSLVEAYLSKDVKRFFCTDIKKDGLLEGTNIDLYKKILQRFNSIELIASGGVSSLEEIKKLEDTGCSGVIIGKAIYEQQIDLSALAKLNSPC